MCGFVALVGVLLLEKITVGKDYLILFFSLFELGSEQSQVSRSWIWACICGFVAFSGILDPSSDHIPPLPAISSFLSSANDTIDSDTPNTPPSPTHGTPFTEITSSTQRSPVIPRRRVMTLAPRHPIPHGRPYRYHLNGPVHMMTVRKRVGPLPVQQLVVRHYVDHYSFDSSSEASSDFHSDASSDSSLRHSLSDHSSPDLSSTFVGLSRKRRRSPMAYVPALPHVSEALSLARVDLIPSPKRIRSH
ncbi:hypothetical protein Tco_1158817, partial [Tanacetum coccineum]